MIKARRALGKESQTSKPLCHLSCSVAPLLVASLTNFEHFGYTKPQRVYPLHTLGEVRTSQLEGGGSMLSWLRMAAPLARRIEA